MRGWRLNAWAMAQREYTLQQRNCELEVSLLWQNLLIVWTNRREYPKTKRQSVIEQCRRVHTKCGWRRLRKGAGERSDRRDLCGVYCTQKDVSTPTFSVCLSARTCVKLRRMFNKSFPYYVTASLHVALYSFWLPSLFSIIASTSTHLSRTGTSLNVSYRQKSGSSSRIHSRTEISTSSLLCDVPIWNKCISMLGDYVIKKYTSVEPVSCV